MDEEIDDERKARIYRYGSAEREPTSRRIKHELGNFKTKQFFFILALINLLMFCYYPHSFILTHEVNYLNKYVKIRTI